MHRRRSGTARRASALGGFEAIGAATLAFAVLTAACSGHSSGRPAAAQWLPRPITHHALADRPRLDADDLRLLAARHGPRLYSAIARNPNCPPELLHTMARNSQAVQKALREIARHPAAEPRTLILCLDDREARQHTAANPALAADVLVALVESPDRRDARTAAANPSLPVEWVRKTITGHEAIASAVQKTRARKDPASLSTSAGQRPALSLQRPISVRSQFPGGLPAL